MPKRFLVFIFLAVFCISATGCFLLLAGAAGGAGTATWLSGKLVEEVNASREKTVSASERALGALKYPVTKKTVDETVTQIKAEYSDGRTIWVDVHKILPKASRIEIRVGMTSDKAAARKLMTQIEKYL